jgi:hypothetical protein
MTSLAITIPPDQICKAGEPVFPELRRRLESYSRSKILTLIDEREAYGIAKYGQTLMSEDGRDTPTEIVNELLDGLVYTTKWCMQNPNDRQIAEYHRALRVMLADMVDYINMRRLP